jgi:hypothetical protein
MATDADERGEGGLLAALSLLAAADPSPWFCAHCGERVSEESAVLLEHDGVRMTSCSSCSPEDR